jgi:hypothetical protein
MLRELAVQVSSIFFIELGTGYFTKIGLIGRLETYAGIGYGRYEVGDFTFGDELANSIAAKCYRIFIQPAIGLTTVSYDISLASRFVKLNFLPGSAVYRNLSGSFIEPALSIKTGKGKNRFLFQIGYSFPFYPDEIKFEYHPLVLSIGIEFRDSFDYLFRKKEVVKSEY